MKIAVYMGSSESSNEIYPRIISILPADSDIYFLHSINALEAQLRGSRLGTMVILLVPDDRSDILALYRLQDLLRSVRLVIMLPPESSAEILNCAHSLYPRYLCFQPDGLSHLGTVIEKLSCYEREIAPPRRPAISLEKGSN